MAYPTAARSSCAWRCAWVPTPRRRACPDRASCAAHRSARLSLHPRPWRTSIVVVVVVVIVIVVMIVIMLMVEVVLVLARRKADALSGRLGRARLDQLLEQHVHEHVHRLALHHERARRLLWVGVEMLMDAIVVH